MLGLSTFAETTFGATAFDDLTIVVVVTGSGVTVSSGTPTYTISGLVIPTGSEVTVSTGAADVNVITWNAIDPDASQTWTNIDPL
jgi:hypothetical protein|tara:strand:+ start:2624 stop:2878 length:255 start_codon:yes stop_codon:yes gene_type:complete